MNAIRGSICCYICLIIFFVVGCSAKEEDIVEIKHYPLDSLEGVINISEVRIDKEISSDQNGSLRITATKPSTVRLFETGDLDIEEALLAYQAKLRSADIEGQAYIEMWCHFPGKGECFSRAFGSPLSGSNEWVSQETFFFLKAGQNPDNIKLNLVITGKGTVWIDDIYLMKKSL